MRPHISWLVWLGTLVLLLGIVALDLAVFARRQQAVTIRGAVRWIAVYVCLALAFAVGLLVMLGTPSSGQFLASYVTEYSLSADNLFVFMVIMTKFAVPAVALDRVLYLGIVLSLLLRGAFIAAGAVAVNTFSWTFYIFGGFLLYTAVRLVLDHGEEGAVGDGPPREQLGLRLLRRLLPMTPGYSGYRYVIRVEGRTQFTPLVLVTTAIAFANVMFALDSMPAVFGLTRSGYLIFTANAFAMMGLRHLYFLIQGLLQRLVYLGPGLAILLSFIGVKLLIEALHGSHVEQIGPVPVPTVGTGLSLAVIVAVLALTAAASLLRVRWQRRHS